MMKFVSGEWFVEHEKLLKAEFSKPSTSSAELVEIYQNWDGGKSAWVYYRIVSGLLEETKRGEGEDNLPKAMFGVSGEYGNYVSVIKGELDPKKGLMTGKFKLDGNMMKAMGLLGIYARITECKKVPGMEL
jgi:hypothetical protein